MPAAFSRFVVFIAVAVFLAGCASVGVGPKTAPDDPPVREFSTTDAIGQLNAFRQASGIGPVSEDQALDTQAVQLASRYALLGEQTQPAGVQGILYVAGGKTFEESFKALRDNRLGIQTLTNRNVTRAGLGSISLDGQTAYWVILLN